MHLRKTRAIKLLPLFFIIFMISCRSDMLLVNSNSDYYSVNTGGNNTKSNTKYIITGFLPDLSKIKNYNERFIIQDKFLSQEKEIVAATDTGFVLINAKNNYIKNDRISLTVAGSPNKVYSLKIHYKSGYSTAKGLGNVKSDKNGYAIWSFKIGNISPSDDFVPWFEVSDGLTIIKHYFNIGDTKNSDIIQKEEVITAANQETQPDDDKTTDVTDKVLDIDKESSTESIALQTEAETAEETEAETQKIVEQETTSPKLKIIFINARDIYYRGENVTLIISGKANTVYKLRIKYKSGYSTAKGLGDTQSDASGVASWKFKISTNADIKILPWFEVSSEGAAAIINFKLADAPETERETSAQTTGQQENAPETQPETQLQTSQDNGSKIVFVDIKQSYSKGDKVTLTIKGLPETVYTLRIKYKSGYSTAQGLGEATSGKDGMVAWSFKIGSRVNTADFTPLFEVSGGGETAIRYFEVTN